MSRKANKKAALASLKSARMTGLARYNADDDDNNGTAPKSILDTVQFSDPEDVYETMTENEYREYVERKREREDFVVDDDGLGYHDDGEYDVRAMGANDEQLAESGKKKRRGNGTAALTKEALRKARRNKAAGEGKGGECFCRSICAHLVFSNDISLDFNMQRKKKSRPRPCGILSIREFPTPQQNVAKKPPPAGVTILMIS